MAVLRVLVGSAFLSVNDRAQITESPKIQRTVSLTAGIFQPRFGEFLPEGPCA